MRSDDLESTNDMKLKLDANGNVVLQDGKPVYIKDDASEVAFDAASTVATITRLNSEAKSNRERAEAAEKGLKVFEGITDPAEALKALNVVKGLDAKKLIDAGESEKVVAAAIKAVEEKYAPVVAERDQFKANLFAEKIGGGFARSKFIADKLIIPADLAQARFGQHFTVENGKIIAKDANGNQIYSATRPGEIADFDEAISTLVDQYPHKASILKGSGASGSGAGQGASGAGGKKTFTRAQFDSLDAAGKATAAKEVTSGAAVITD